MTQYCFFVFYWFSRLASTRRDGLHTFTGAWRRCSASQWNDHSSLSRLALHPQKYALHPVQPRFLG